MDQDIQNLIDQYEKAKSEAAAAYKKMAGTEPRLYQVWEQVQAIRKRVMERANNNEPHDPNALAIATYGPEIVLAAFKANEYPWLVASQEAAKKLEMIVKRLNPDQAT